MLGIPADASWLRLTGDELHAFYVLPGAGIARIVSTQRVSKDAAFEAGTELGDGVNQASVLSDPLPSDDGLTLRYTKNGNSVYVATRASLEAPFETGTLALDNAKSMVLARDGSIVAYARYLRYPTFMFPARWLVFGQPVGAGEHAFVLADPGVDAYPTWYESLSQQAWIARGAETLIYTWDGDWHAAGATDFRVSWTSPNGCRLYGRHDNVIVMRSRIPIPPAPVDADAGPDSGN